MVKWVRHDEVLPAVGGPIRVWAREGDLQALEFARQFLAGGIQGVEMVPSAATARVHRAPLQERFVYCKEYFPRDTFEPVKDLFRPSRAHRALRGAAICEEAGFHVPHPLCLVVTGPRLRPTRSILARSGISATSG